MDSFQLHYVDHYEAVPGQGSQVRYTSKHPYVRICQGSGPAIYVKEGVICGENGVPVDERQLPPWFWDQARHISPAMREQVKLVLPEEREAPKPSKAKRTPVVAAPPAVKHVPEGYYACVEPGCEDMVPMQRKGLHIAKHRRDAAATAKPVVAGAI